MKTWGEVKRELETQGVTDSMKVDYIAIYGALGKIKVSLPENDDNSFTADQPVRVLKARLEDDEFEPEEIEQYRKENKDYL